jgi:dTDP-4-dehydrorhamnose 3,5-epimerase/reductase
MTSFEKLHIQDAWRITLPYFADERGYFQEIFQELKYPEDVQPKTGISQVSISHSVRDTLRGMHTSKYSKHVTVIRGEIYDVMCDLRVDSPTFRRWAVVKLSQNNRQQIFVPPGVAHGFYCCEDATVLYLQGGVFNPPEEIDVNPFDPNIAILWPAPYERYIMSDKDRKSQSFSCIHPLAGKLPPLRRLLVIGASGQLGRAITEFYGANNVIGTFNTHQETGMMLLQFNLDGLNEKQEKLENFIQSIRPEIVFLCAGFTWVDGCELEEEKALTVNANSPALIASTVKRFGGKTVFYSTDYVFDGCENKLWSEEDSAFPLNVYGKSKLEGEKNLMEADPEALIIRTTGVFGPDKNEKNFVYQLCKTISNGGTFKCAVDQFGCPTYSRDLAEISAKLLNLGQKGIFHCVGSQTLDRYTFALKIADFFKLPTENIIASSTSELYIETKQRLGVAAERGSHLGLDIKKLTEVLKGTKPRDLNSSLQDWLLHPAGISLPSNRIE